jgi:LmbE family N-acetylglucosaminyl deacetylase
MSKSVLIVAAHPDDETLGCGGSMAKHLHQGDRVRVAVLTDGRHLFRAFLGIEDDPTPQKTAQLRAAETIAACKICGLAEEHIQFLNYEDGTLSEEFAKVQENEGSSLVEQLAGMMRQWNPDLVYCTCSQDDHPDHRAAYFLVQEAIRELDPPPPVWQYPISPRNQPRLADLPGTLMRTDITEFLALKRRAVLGFNCHLQIVSPHQTAPIWDVQQAGEYIQAEEIFWKQARANA